MSILNVSVQINIIGNLDGEQFDLQIVGVKMSLQTDHPASNSVEKHT